MSPHASSSTDLNLTLGAGAAEPQIQAHLSRLATELERELVQTQEQLNFVCAITGRVATLRDTDQIQHTLLHDLATMLSADALFLDRGGCCIRIAPEETGTPEVLPPMYSCDAIRVALATHVETVRLDGRAAVVQELPQLDGARVIIAALPRSDSETGVVIALRRRSKPPFAASSVLAVEAVLGHGAEVLANVAMVRHLQRTTLETVYVLVNAIDAKDNYTSDHSERVGALARLIGNELHLPAASLQTLEWAGLLHDVGKIGVPEHILNKPGPLTTEEYALMKDHSRIGYDILRPVTRFEPFLNAVLHHHENHDGSGYPVGLAGADIPIEARIVHVADIFDALTTSRPYRAAFGVQAALDIVTQGAGRVSDPDVTAAFVSTMRNTDFADRRLTRPRFDHLAGDA